MGSKKKGAEVLDHNRIQTIIERLAHQIHEHHHDAKELILIGIAGRGVDLRDRIALILNALSSLKLTKAEIRVHKTDPLSKEVVMDLDLSQMTSKVVILIDDVLNSGKTLAHSMGHIMTADPTYLRTAVLVDRIHRNFPVRADFVGLSLSTTIQDRVEVEFGKEDYAYLV